MSFVLKIILFLFPCLVGCAGLSFQGTTQEVGTEELKALISNELADGESETPEEASEAEGDTTKEGVKFKVGRPAYIVNIYQISGNADPAGTQTFQDLLKDFLTPKP